MRLTNDLCKKETHQQQPKPSTMSRIPYLLFVLLVLSGCTKKSEPELQKAINVRQNFNLEVLFTIYNQIWTPFLYEGVDQSMLDNTRLMKINHDYFQEFKEHKAVRNAQEFMNKSGTDFFLYAFFYDDFPNPKRVMEIPPVLTDGINPDRELALAEIDALMDDIAEFFLESDFNAFYQKYADTYELASGEVVKNLPDEDFIPFMETYFGNEYANYDFYIIPFFKAEFGMAYQLEKETGIENITFIAPFEPATVDQDGIISYVGYNSREDILEWVVHEYAHTFFNPSLTTEENLERLQGFEHLYKPIHGSPQIGDWFSVFGEHIAVAFEVRAAELLGDKERSAALLEKHRDWFYLDHFINQLKTYESNRDEYPNIDSFITRLIDSCGELK